jgi:hypothetical protein
MGKVGQSIRGDASLLKRRVDVLCRTTTLPQGRRKRPHSSPHLSRPYAIHTRAIDLCSMMLIEYLQRVERKYIHGSIDYRA